MKYIIAAVVLSSGSFLTGMICLKREYWLLGLFLLIVLPIGLGATAALLSNIYGNETMNGYYRFIDESGEETICYKVDSYTIDADKQQVEDERYTQAVKDQINTEVNSFAPNIWTNLVVGLLCIAGIFIVWFILSTLFG